MVARDGFPDEPFAAVLGPIPDGAPSYVRTSQGILNDLVDLGEIPLGSGQELWDIHIQELKAGRPRAEGAIIESEWMKRYKVLEAQQKQGRFEI
ncbi:MAG: hypothetical protein Q7K03_06510 [Dehalococcoidia bacterium]|nr:hypothetical protein [Dehalococcoidia bacterium]